MSAQPRLKKQKITKKLKTDDVDTKNQTLLPRDSNQALGIANFAIDFMKGSLGSGPSEAVLKRTELFHTDSVVCGLSALALKCNAPTVLRDEALEYKAPPGRGARVFGSEECIMPEKACVANCCAVREWDSNGTVFGFDGRLGHTAGEFGHNDFYPVSVAAAQMKKLDGKTTLMAMLLSDEIRGRLSSVFSLKSYKIDHVVHGAIASAATYGALLGATAKQIESAIGMVVAHYVPWRAIRAGHQLSDSKGASAAISTEVAMLCVHRAMRGFLGPQDIFRNPESLFRQFEPTEGDESPFDLVLTHSGEDFSVMGMHFKLGLYEHQSAGALQGLINVVTQHPEVLKSGVRSIKIVAYQPAFGIIGDPEKRDPHTRQSADHSMVFIVSRMLKKALALGDAVGSDSDGAWKKLMLEPQDYSAEALACKETRALMDKISFAHGGEEYDSRYPEGIPTSVVITTSDGKEFDSKLVMFPSGHAGNKTCDLEGILRHKFSMLGALAVEDVPSCLAQLGNLAQKSAEEVQGLYHFKIKYSGKRGDY